MKHNVNFDVSDVTFGSIYDSPYIPEEYKDDIQKASILMLPIDISDGVLIFPEGTRDFYRFAKNNIEDSGLIEIVASDDSYAEKELHSDLIRLGVFILQEVVVPVLLSIVANFIYDKKKNRNPKEPEPNINISIIVEEKNKRINYEGPASELNNAISESLRFIDKSKES